MANTKLKRFLRKTHLFLKTNALALIISFTTVLSLSIMGLAAYFSLQTNGSAGGPTGGNTTPVGNNEPVVFVSPLDEVKISHDYADDHLLKDSTTNVWQTHQAIDFAATEGAAVKAVYTGTIESVKSSSTDGMVVTLKISDKLKVVYKSLASEVLVSEGDKVDAGQQIGTASINVIEKGEGVHVHLEVWQDGKLVDPNLYFSFGDK